MEVSFTTVSGIATTLFFREFYRDITDHKDMSSAARDRQNPQIAFSKSADAESKFAETDAPLVQAKLHSVLGELSSHVIHDINNPLAIIAGYVSIAKLVAEEMRPFVQGLGLRSLEDLEEKLKRMEIASEQITRLTRTVQNFSRPASKHRAVLNLRDLYGEAKLLVNDSLSKQRVKLSLELQGPADEFVVSGDRSGLLQALVHLLLNSRDAFEGMPKEYDRKIEVVCRVVSDPQSESKIEVSVRDNGNGIPAANVERVFEPFFTSKTAGIGIGLGLPMALGVVKEHGGDLTCLSVPGEFTEFRITLPKYKPERIA